MKKLKNLRSFLTVSTLLVLVDKKYRYIFLSWKDEDFVEDLNWLNKELAKKNNK